MKNEQTFIDKSDWPEGPWMSEPDRVSWVDPATGYSCLIRRNGTEGMGFLCGYVAVEKGHLLYEKDSSKAAVNVHYGLTYSEHCDGDTELGICHAAQDDDKSWWFGFDCAHGDDEWPGHLKISSSFPNIIPPSLLKAQEEFYKAFEEWRPTYKDISFVTQECESLAKQLKEIEDESCSV